MDVDMKSGKELELYLGNFYLCIRRQGIRKSNSFYGTLELPDALVSHLNMHFLHGDAYYSYTP